MVINRRWNLSCCNQLTDNRSLLKFNLNKFRLHMNNWINWLYLELHFTKKVMIIFETEMAPQLETDGEHKTNTVNEEFLHLFPNYKGKRSARTLIDSRFWKSSKLSHKLHGWFILGRKSFVRRKEEGLNSPPSSRLMICFIAKLREIFFPTEEQRSLGSRDERARVGVMFLMALPHLVNRKNITENIATIYQT